MKAEDLIIGATYRLKDSIGVYKGKQPQGGRHKFYWLQNNNGWSYYGIRQPENITALVLLSLPEEYEEVTTQTKVQRKITLLWKTSNYVKNHPNLIY